MIRNPQQTDGIMKANDNSRDLYSNGVYYFLTAAAAVPVWLAIDAYTKIKHIQEDEAVSTAATACLLTGIFIGRYFGKLWIVNGKAITNQLLFSLGTVIFVSILFLFAPAVLFGGNGDYEILSLLLSWGAFVAMSVATGMMIKLVRAAGQKQLKEAQASAAHSKTELHLLQSQLSPHFLFNTLNNLYGLSITQHERIPPLLLQLSDLLRYAVYDANEIFVPLKNELIYIGNYIEFEKIRIGERLVLTTNFQNIASEDVKIAPMLLLVFIENAFKHSKNSSDEHIYIDIELKTWNNLILFSIKNSHQKQKEEDRIMDGNSGFGLTSVNKRLELLYHNEHELTIENNETSYSVVLRLKVK
jgi:sensor histidine kinase YesM